MYELVNEFASQRELLHRYLSTDYDYNGWMSAIANKYQFSSPMYIERIIPSIDYHLFPMENLESDLRDEMSKIFFSDAVDEFILTYLSPELNLLRERKRLAQLISKREHFQKRPFVKYSAELNSDIEM